MPTLSRTFPVARKDHRCTDCRAVIAKGERYHHWKGTDDAWEGIATMKECVGCCERYGRPIPDPLAPPNKHARTEDT